MTASEDRGETWLNNLHVGRYVHRSKLFPASAKMTSIVLTGASNFCFVCFLIVTGLTVWHSHSPLSCSVTPLRMCFSSGQGGSWLVCIWASAARLVMYSHHQVWLSNRQISAWRVDLMSWKMFATNFSFEWVRWCIIGLGDRAKI